MISVMKKQVKRYLTKILWSVAMIIFISACSSSDDILDEYYIPTEEDITETLKKSIRNGAHPRNLSCNI